MTAEQKLELVLAAVERVARGHFTPPVTDGDGKCLHGHDHFEDCPVCITDTLNEIITRVADPPPDGLMIPEQAA